MTTRVLHRLRDVFLPKYCSKYFEIAYPRKMTDIITFLSHGRLGFSCRSAASGEMWLLHARNYGQILASGFGEEFARPTLLLRSLGCRVQIDSLYLYPFGARGSPVLSWRMWTFPIFWTSWHRVAIVGSTLRSVCPRT